MFELDKYTDTVLLAYTVSIILLGTLIWATLSKSKRIKRTLDAQEQKTDDKR